MQGFSYIQQVTPTVWRIHFPGEHNSRAVDTSHRDDGYPYCDGRDRMIEPCGSRCEHARRIKALTR